MTARPALWHFTCDHGYAAIGKRGLLRPNRHPLMPELGAVVWLTCDAMPDRDDVGLTSASLSCDRMAYRYRAKALEAVQWASVADLVRPAVRADLERFAEPAMWWVSITPVEAVLS